MTAANSNYYDPLQATVYHVHKFFPDYRLIVYDLGLDNHQYEKVDFFTFIGQLFLLNKMIFETFKLPFVNNSTDLIIQIGWIYIFQIKKSLDFLLSYLL